MILFCKSRRVTKVCVISIPTLLGGGSAAAAASDVIWTPKAKKVAEEAGLDPESITDITATGPGKRVSGDDVKQYLENRG